MLLTFPLNTRPSFTRCGHCKALKPEYRKLAEYFKDESEIVIAAMDADTHKPPSKYSVSVSSHFICKSYYSD